MQGGAEGLAEARADKAWSLPLGAAVLGVRQLGLSGWEQTECFALENEIGAWQQAGKLAEPLNALRWVLRCPLYLGVLCRVWDTVPKRLQRGRVLCAED